MSASEADRWREDLARYEKELPLRHIDLFHRIAESTFHRRVDKIRQQLDMLTPLQAEIELRQLTFDIGGGVSDGHTAVKILPDRYRWLPISFENFQGHWYVTGTSATYASLLGARVKSVGSAPPGMDSQVEVHGTRALWYGFMDDTKQAIYVRFDRYPSVACMEQFSEELRKAIVKAKSPSLVIDLRWNGGGNGFVGLRLAEALLDENTINWKSGVYVLIGRRTYSAAMMNALDYRRLLNATLVGEPTGGNPMGYQDTGRFQLPNSGLWISFSKRLYRLQDSEYNSVQPDVEVVRTLEASLHGRDEVLEWVETRLSKTR